MREMTSQLNRTRLAALLIIVALSLSFASACSKKVTPETPRAGVALTADALVIRVNELQATVIQACGPQVTCAPNTISTALARDIVQTCIDIRTTALAVPNGWQAAVRTAWSRAKPRFAGVTNPAIQAAISAVDALLSSL